MAETVIRIKTRGASELYRDDSSPRHPIVRNKGVRTLLHRYVVNTDFPSGDNLRIDIDGAQKILKAIFKTPSNTFLTCVETDLATETGDTSRQGISLTTGTSTTDVQMEVVFEV